MQLVLEHAEKKKKNTHTRPKSGCPARSSAREFHFGRGFPSGPARRRCQRSLSKDLSRALARGVQTFVQRAHSSSTCPTKLYLNRSKWPNFGSQFYPFNSTLTQRVFDSDVLFFVVNRENINYREVAGFR